MATYYYNKIEALQICKITGKDAVSCVIDGLQNNMIQNGARAGRYEAPETLYEEYLSRISDEPKTEKRKREEGLMEQHERVRTHQRERPQHKFYDKNRKVRCFNCSRESHVAQKF